MQIIAHSILSRGDAGTQRAMLTFPSLTTLRNGSLLATLRAGSTKDSADEHIELYESRDNGQSWNLLGNMAHNQAMAELPGSLRVCYLTELAPGRILAAAMWIDRNRYPDQPLFNPETEGCLPMHILLAESSDNGLSWSSWRQVPMPAEIGPASLTNPLLLLPDATLAMSIETNKHYEDRSPWLQRVVLFHSSDAGQHWAAPVIAGCDPQGRIFNWDLRLAVTPDGRIGSFAWVYDSFEKVYRNIHRRISSDGGQSWSAPEDLGFADQAGHPAILTDGRVVLPWVDRYGTQTIRVRLANDIAAPFEASTELVLYTLNQDRSATPDASTGTLLTGMSLWTFGLPYAETLPDGDVGVLYYAGNDSSMGIHWVRLRI